MHKVSTFFLQLCYMHIQGIGDVITCDTTCHTHIAHSKLKGLQLYVGVQLSLTSIFCPCILLTEAMNGLHDTDILVNVVFSCGT